MADEFELDAWEVQLINWVSLGCAIFSLVLCLFILIATIWVWSKKHARPLLDRISFRLFWWTMAWELLYDIGYIAGEVYTGEQAASSTTGQVAQSTSPACSGGIYLLLAPMGVVNYLCTCIAINLMLIICFGVNPTERKLERWYVGVSIGLGCFIPIVPIALGHFGRDPLLEVYCWIVAVNDEKRMMYLVLDLYLWQLLSCVVATIAVGMTIFSIFRLRRATSKAMYLSNTLNRSQIDSAGGKFADFDDQFLKMALRISTYPVVMIIVNGLISGVDLYVSSVGGVHNCAAYAFYYIYWILYGGRGICFALLGLFVDPCLRKGMRAAWRGPIPTFRPPISLSIPSEDLNPKKSGINSSLLPSISYTGTTCPDHEHAVIDEQNQARRESDMSVMAAITRIQPGPDDLRAVEEAAPVAVAASSRRGSRKEVDDTIL